jgi:hypothetical protein
LNLQQTNNEMKHLLIEAKSEIERLRRHNEILGAKVEVMNLFGTLLHTYPSGGEGAMCADIAWSLQRGIEELEAKEAAEKEAAYAMQLHLAKVAAHTEAQDDLMPGPPNPPKGLHPREVG